MFGRTLVRAIPLTLIIDSHDRWGQIASRTAKLKKGGSNLGGCAAAFVAALSVMFAIIYIILGVLGRSDIMGAVSVVGSIVIIIVYLVGAAKLSKALGDGNDTGVRVVTLTRQVAGAQVLYIFVGGAWTVLGNSGPMPVQMIIANLLMPVSLIAAPLLLIRFIRQVLRFVLRWKFGKGGI